MEQKIEITMTKKEAIKYYANKIIEDSIEECSEFNYRMSVDNYDDNGFVKENYNEIFERISNDERVADCYMDTSDEIYEFDMVFWLDYCPEYYEEYDLSEETQGDVLRKFIDKLIQIKGYMFKHSMTCREVIRDFLNENNFKGEFKDDVYNMLKHFISETDFFYKYIDKDKVIINNKNAIELIVELNEKCKEFECYKQKSIKVVTTDEVNEMLEIFGNDKIYPERYIGYFICRDGDTYLAIDNTSGEMYIDEYKSKKKCIDSLFSRLDEQDEDLIYEKEEEDENEQI